MITDKKQYRLLKELFNWTTGHIVPIGELFEQLPETRKYHSKNGWFVSEAACLNKEYFEEVPVLSEKVAEVETKGFERIRIHFDKVYGSSYDYLVKDLEQILFKDMHPESLPKRYSQAEVDAMIKEAFIQARRGTRSSEDAAGYMVGNFIFKTGDDYLSSLNLKTNDTGKGECVFNSAKIEEQINHINELEECFNAARLTNPIAGMKYDTFKDYCNDKMKWLTEALKSEPLPSDTVSKEWQILSYEFDNRIQIPNTEPYITLSNNFKDKQYSISRVKRLSDNQVFAIGDSIQFGSVKAGKEMQMELKNAKISSWSIREDSMIYAEVLKDIFFPITHLHKSTNE